MSWLPAESAAAAAAVVVVAVVLAFASSCSTTCNVLSLHFLILLSVFLSLHFSLSVSSTAPDGSNFSNISCVRLTHPHFRSIAWFRLLLSRQSIPLVPSFTSAFLGPPALFFPFLALLWASLLASFSHPSRSHSSRVLLPFQELPVRFPFFLTPSESPVLSSRPPWRPSLFFLVFSPWASTFLSCFLRSSSAFACLICFSPSL